MSFGNWLLLSSATNALPLEADRLGLDSQSSKGVSQRSKFHIGHAATNVHSIRDRVYKPNERIRTLQSVWQAEAPLELSCNKCGEKLMASWMYMQHGKSHVLVPNNGHYICRGLFVPAAGILWKRDVIGDLIFCHHGIMARQCWRCGGSKTCIHRKQRYSCKVCRSIQKAERGQL
eukprot:TRINITY_DN14344_c0_g1_i1.p1 TRINITY_DN14344_c0_g1~~TRINITY_DN14344_c0_g1_i1.p1  ORF type:complete len:175 (+),score=19.34 TRINITY_DN14344_c0_g1_i1:789-1313(+)